MVTLEDDDDQIDKYNNVDEEDAYPHPGEAMHEFANLDGQKRCGDGEGEIFGPCLFKVEANAFHDADSGITEGTETDAAQGGIVEERGLVEDEVDEAAFRIEAEVRDDAREDVAYIFSDEVQRTYTHCSEDQSDE